MRIVIVDDDKLVGLSLKTIIEAQGDISVAGIGYNGHDAIALYENIRPDIMMMDIRMDKMTGLEAGEQILKNHPEARILYLTTFSDDEYIIKALRMGAKGYILKQNFESIVPSLLAVQAGQRVFGDDIVAKIPSLISGIQKPDIKLSGLSDRERDIAELIAQGLSNKEIADKLYLSEGTVRNNISIMLEKLGLKGRTQIAIYYYKQLA